MAYSLLLSSFDLRTCVFYSWEDIILRGDLYTFLTGSVEVKCVRNLPTTQDGWFLSHLALPDFQGYNIAYQVLNSDRACANMPSRLRGQVQSETW